MVATELRAQPLGAPGQPLALLTRAASGLLALTWLGPYVGPYMGLLTGASKQPLQQGPELPKRTKVAVDIKPLHQLDCIVHVDTSSSVGEVQAAVEATSGISPARQCLLVCEERRRTGRLSSSLGAQLQQIARQFSSRQEAYKLLLGCTKFVLLSEALNREVSGRGLLGLIKCGLAERLKEASQEGLPGVSLRVYTLDGKTYLLEVSHDIPLSKALTLVHQATGVKAQHQRMVVEEREAPTALTYLGNAVLLRSYNSMRLAAATVLQGRARLGHWMRGDETFPVTVQLETGDAHCSTTLRVTGDVTLDQLRAMAADQAFGQGLPSPLPGVVCPPCALGTLTGLTLPAPLLESEDESLALAGSPANAAGSSTLRPVF